MKNKSLILLIISVFLVLVSCKSDDSVTVFSGGETSYTIITAEEASDEVLELANGLSDLSGAYPEILTDASKETSLEILLGDTSRKASQELAKELKSQATVSAFHYIVAESDGKLIVLSDSNVGYIYALDYIKNTYITDGTLKIPRGTYDIKEIVWDDYYASDYYFDRLLADAEKNRYEEGNKLLENEMNRYDDVGGNTIMTVEQAIEYYKKQAANFNTSDFGEYSAETFSNVKKYAQPTEKPAESHPRILFNNSTIETVRENLEKEQNSYAYKKYIALSDSPCDGKFKTLSGNMTHNFDYDIVSKIEAKAFRYAMTGEKIYGYEAIYAAKNAMLTINVPHTVGDWCRTYGFLMYVVACVYDWCYDLLEPADEDQLIAGCVNLLGVHLEMVCYVGDGNKVPTEQGAAYGHGAEDQLLVDYLSFAIACYDKAPEIYNVVAGRILDEYTEMQNYLFESDSHWEGAMYGGVRSAATIMANYLFNGMSEKKFLPFENLVEAATTYTYYVRPDGQRYRIGDMDENYTEFSPTTWAVVCFYAANMYENSYLKNFAYESLQNFNYFKIGVAGLTPVQFLATNNPDVSHIYTGTAPLTRTTSYPNTSIFAKSVHDDKNAFGIYMTMPENFVASHAHMDCGSFQIIYNGSILASDSGAYAGWGSKHHMGYTMQTVSSNSLLVYNPTLAGTVNATQKNMIYTGGQSVLKSAVLPLTLSQLENHERLGQCTSLGVANVEDKNGYLYSYMGGDMSKAYDSSTLGEGGEVTRYMFAVATGDEKCPYAFITFDRITAADASYKKSALIHVQDEPTVLGGYYALTDATDGKLVEIGSANSDNYAIITNGDGRLVVQSVGYDTEYTIIGGEGYDCWIAGVDENKNYSLEDGYNLEHGVTLKEGSLAEYGWGRIEISPKVMANTNHMLTVMYVTDVTNGDTVKANNIESDNLAGAVIFGKAVLFPENESLLKTESSFTLQEGVECFIAGVDAGAWKVTKDGAQIAELEVKDGENLITFTASEQGKYTITPVE